MIKTQNDVFFKQPVMANAISTHTHTDRQKSSTQTIAIGYRWANYANSHCIKLSAADTSTNSQHSFSPFSLSLTLITSMAFIPFDFINTKWLLSVVRGRGEEGEEGRWRGNLLMILYDLTALHFTACLLTDQRQLVHDELQLRGKEKHTHAIIYDAIRS